MGAKESTEEPPNKPTENIRCSCPEPHRGDILEEETQNGLNTEPKFDRHQVKRDLIELARFFMAPTGKYSTEASSIEQQICNKALNFYSVMGTEQVECSTRKSHPLGPDGKPLKPCCVCLETKRNRDACIIEKGEENCSELIEAHKACMRSLGFNI